MRRLSVGIGLSMLVVLQGGTLPALADTPRVVAAHPCTDGLYRQPDGGAFAVMLFCDDAAANNLGVLCYSGNLCTRPPWDVTDRFWQDAQWAADVNAFAWGPNGRCLYVSNNAIYGEGDVFVLDLWNRRAKVLPLRVTGHPYPDFRYERKLTRIDHEKRTLEYSIVYHDKRKGRTVSELVTVPLPTCGDE